MIIMVTAVWCWSEWWMLLKLTCHFFCLLLVITVWSFAHMTLFFTQHLFTYVLLLNLRRPASLKLSKVVDPRGQPLEKNGSNTFSDICNCSLKYFKSYIKMELYAFWKLSISEMAISSSLDRISVLFKFSFQCIDIATITRFLHFFLVHEKRESIFR